MFTAEHGGRVLPDVRGTVLATLVSLALAGAVPLPLGAPPSASPAHLLGPWSLLGLQGALAWLPPAAGWLLPLGLFLLLGLARHLEGRARRTVLAALVAACAAYALLTVRVLLSSRA